MSNDLRFSWHKTWSWNITSLLWLRHHTVIIWKGLQFAQIKLHSAGKSLQSMMLRLNHMNTRHNGIVLFFVISNEVMKANPFVSLVWQLSYIYSCTEKNYIHVRTGTSWALQKSIWFTKVHFKYKQHSFKHNSKCKIGQNFSTISMNIQLHDWIWNFVIYLVFLCVNIVYLNNINKVYQH